MNTDWFKDARYGVFMHFLPADAKGLALVNDFDVEALAGQLEAVLERHHCTRIDARDKPFDPNLHQAICQQPSDEHPANTVLQVTQIGFRLHDRVVRPSQVVVSAAVPETGEPAEAEEGEQAHKRDGQESDAAS